jgi:hypothetical protein
MRSPQFKNCIIKCNNRRYFTHEQLKFVHITLYANFPWCCWPRNGKPQCQLDARLRRLKASRASRPPIQPHQPWQHQFPELRALRYQGLPQQIYREHSDYLCHEQHLRRRYHQSRDPSRPATKSLQQHQPTPARMSSQRRQLLHRRRSKTQLMINPPSRT